MSGQETISFEIGSVINILVTVILVVVSAYLHSLVSGFQDDIGELKEQIDDLVKRCYANHGLGGKEKKDG